MKVQMSHLVATRHLIHEKRRFWKARPYDCWLMNEKHGFLEALAEFALPLG